jgi:hypothetical protein
MRALAISHGSDAVSAIVAAPMVLVVSLVLSVAVGSSAAAASFTNPTAIDNPYLPLSKFHRCTYSGQEDGARQVIKRTVLDRTRSFVVDGVPVEAMVVKDRVHEEGELIEDTHDFFAQDDRGAVRYLGERVRDIRDGRVVGHGGSWLFGRDTDRIGVLMPAHPRRGHRWLSENAPPITVEHDRVVARHDGTVTVREFALPDREVEHKLYARGVGVIAEFPPHGDVGLEGCDPA